MAAAAGAAAEAAVAPAWAGSGAGRAESVTVGGAGAEAGGTVGTSSASPAGWVRSDLTTRRLRSGPSHPRQPPVQAGPRAGLPGPARVEPRSRTLPVQGWGGAARGRARPLSATARLARAGDRRRLRPSGRLLWCPPRHGPGLPARTRPRVPLWMLQIGMFRHPCDLAHRAGMHRPGVWPGRWPMRSAGRHPRLPQRSKARAVVRACARSTAATTGWAAD